MSTYENGRASDSPYLFRFDAAAVVVILLLVLFIFGDALLSPSDDVVFSGEDIFYYFSWSRAFACEEMQQGNLPLWNPHILSGAPYFGNFQSALLYPINCVYLFLPVARALNIDMALHVFLLGFFAYLFARRIGLPPLPGVYVGATLMLSAPYFLHVYAGHVTLVAALAWAPLVFLCADEVVERPTLGWVLAGIAAFSMQILAGFPQAVYNTVLAIGVYAALRLVKAERRTLSCLALITMTAFPLFLTAIQLWSGISVAEESGRDGGLPYEAAASFSFPVENLITLLAPTVFGPSEYTAYWGKGLAWECGAFAGITTLALAVFGVCHGRSGRKWPFLFLFVFFGVLALGKETFLHRLFFDWVPGFDMFRAPGRFMCWSVLPLVLLAGMGARALSEGKVRTTPVVVGLVVLFLILTVSAAGVLTSRAAVELAATSISPLGQNVLDEHLLAELSQGAQGAGKALFVAAGTCLVLASLLMLVRDRALSAGAILALGVAEVLAFGLSCRSDSTLLQMHDARVSAFLHERPGDYRVLDPTRASRGLRAGEARKGELWGYEPVLLKRYGQFVARTQNVDSPLIGTTGALGFSTPGRVLGLLRGKWVLPSPETKDKFLPIEDPLPHYFLVNDYRVLDNFDAVFAALEEASFDPHSTVILEQEPVPRPAPGPPDGTVTLMSFSTDYLIFKADLNSPSILIITDAYSSGWQATPENTADPRSYEVLPANWVIRAIPLDAGEHHFRVEYRPRAFVLGMSVSLGSAVLFLLTTAACLGKAVVRRGRTC